MPIAPVRLPRFRNAWLDNIEPNEHPGYAHEVGSNVLSAILYHEAPTLATALQGIPGPVGELEMLGLLWINEAQPAAAAVLGQGFDLLRPGVLLGAAHDYHDEVMGVVRVLAAAGANDPKGDHLTGWLTDLLTERSTSLALTDAVLDGEDEEALRAVVQRLEDRLLRAVLTDPRPAGPAVARSRL